MLDEKTIAYVGILEATNARNDVAILRAQLYACREVLSALEWQPTALSGYCCPVCHMSRSNGHAPDCRLSAVLGGGR